MATRPERTAKAPVVCWDRRPDPDKPETWVNVTGSNDTLLSFISDMAEAAEIKFPGDHAEMLRVWKSVPGDDKDQAVFQRRIAALKAAAPRPITADMLSAQVYDEDARKIGERWSDDVINTLEDAFHAKETWDSAPIAVDWAKVKSEHNPDAPFTQQEVAGWRKPGTRYDKPPYADESGQALPPAQWGTNLGPAVYKKKGTGENVDVYRDMWNASKLGTRYNVIMALIQRAKGDHKSLSPDEAKQLKAATGYNAADFAQPNIYKNAVRREDTRRTNEVNRDKLAVKMRQLIERIDSELPRVSWGFIDCRDPHNPTKAEVKLLAGKRLPLYIGNVGGNALDAMSIGAFCQMDVERALAETPEAKGDKAKMVAADLYQTRKRPQKKPETTGSEKEGTGETFPLLLNPKQFESVLASLCSTLNDVGNRTAAFKEIQKSEEQVDMLFIAKGALDRFCRLLDGKKAAIDKAREQAAANAPGNGKEKVVA